MFNFFRKLLKALNSSGKSWQLSGAIVLAMFTGFLPSNSLLMFDILFLALVFNLNFGVFLLFSVIFAGIGYLFDPIFESIGYSVLTNESLNGFFTSLYNSVIFRWSAFNYTLVTGSLIVSSVLALPLMFILNKTISLYRVQIGQKLNEWKFTRWMKLFNEEQTNTSVFRWWGLGVFGGLAAVIILFIVLLFDPLAKMAMEKGLSYTLKTQVSIKDFSTSISDLSVKVTGLEVADKDKLTHNLVEVETIAFDLGFSALIEKKAMIEFLEVDALSFDTLRASAATAYNSTSKEESESEQRESSNSKEGTNAETSASPFSLPNVDDILAKEELKSLTEAKELKAEIKKTQDKWTKISSELESSDDVAQIKADAKKLEASLKGGDFKKIASMSKDVKALKKKVKGLKSKYTNLQADFKKDQKRLQKRIANLKNLPQEDINRLKKKYSLDASGGANLVGTLINSQVSGYMHTALKYYEMIKPYLNDGKEAELEEVSPPRGQGRWIKYANHSNIPEFLIKKSHINVKLTNDTVDVEIMDLCSNQKLYGKPMTLVVDAKGQSYTSIKANVIDDRRQDIAKTDFDIQLIDFKKEVYDMSSILMKDMLVSAKGKGQVLGNEITAKSSVKVKKVKMQMPSSELVNKLLASINAFKVDIAVSGEVDKPSIKVNSDLQSQLSKGLKSMASNEAKAFEKKLRAGIMKKVSGSTGGMSSSLGDTGSLLDSKQGSLSDINLDFSSSKSNPLKGLMSF